MANKKEAGKETKRKRVRSEEELAKLRKRVQDRRDANNDWKDYIAATTLGWRRGEEKGGTHRRNRRVGLTAMLEDERSLSQVDSNKLPSSIRKIIHGT